MATSQENRIRYLLDRCLSGKETREERKELKTHFTDENAQTSLNEELLNAFYRPKDLINMSPEKQEQILSAIRSLDGKANPEIKIRYWKLAGVAAVFLAVLLSLIWVAKEERLSDGIDITEKKEMDSRSLGNEADDGLDDRDPAKDVAVLEMADGFKIELEKLSFGEIVEKDGMVIERSTEGTLLLRFVTDFEKNKKSANAINTIKTPRGGTYKVILPDKTVVHLNSDSKLSFPTAFSSKERRVTFEGEGYFDVAKDKYRQFVVTSNVGKNKQELRVFGTEFNLSAYTDDHVIKTTLVEGSIKIKELYTGSEIMLKPLESAVLDNKELTSEVADIEASLAWKDDMFYFANASIKIVLKQIGRWYDVDMIYKETIPDEPFWGQISRKKRLSEVLEILEKTNQLKFKIKGKEVTVMK